MTSDKDKSHVTSLDDLFGDFAELVLENVTLEFDELKLSLRPMVQQMARTATQQALSLPKSLISSSFTSPLGEYTQDIQEVTLGATKGQGGTRGSTVTIGGHIAPAWDLFQSPPKNPPIIAADVFDMPISLAKAVKTHYKEVMDDPAEWAKLVVDKFGADVVTLHLISTDRQLGDTSPKDAAKTIEDVLQAVKVPILIGSAGDPVKDGPVLAKAAEVCEGERTLLCSATVDIFEPIAEAAKKHDQVVLSWTSIDINQQKELNRRLFEWLKPEQIIIDPTTAALGYGLEYAFTIMQRMRLGGLLGDEELRFPISSGTTNAWAAREAWLKNPELGPRELRGPIWESVTALALLLAGGDLFMMMHPAAIKTVHDLIDWMKESRKVDDYPDWTTLSIPEGV
ncbi:MAG: CO dehydrogenase/acetyl-CoA synthase subunit delta [Candidatus Thorarchaeota archaeon]|nr:MAG: CO dehydrogenase/acetyl-CoA synthase subunit delta [Candidatus Thorarchaeota archaeon]